MSREEEKVSVIKILEQITRDHKTYVKAEGILPQALAYDQLTNSMLELPKVIKVIRQIEELARAESYSAITDLFQKEEINEE